MPARVTPPPLWWSSGTLGLVCHRGSTKHDCPDAEVSCQTLPYLAAVLFWVLLWGYGWSLLCFRRCCGALCAAWRRDLGQGCGCR